MKTVVVVKPDGTNTRTVELPFAQQLKHHIDYVFAVADDTSAMRTKNRDGMMNFVQNLRPGYKMPDARTIKKILDAITETQLKAQMTLINSVKAAAKGGPAFGLQFDLWTKRKVRDAFMSLRLTFVTEDATTKARSYHDMLLKFGHFPKLRHTAKAIAVWVLHALASVDLAPKDITLATPDGAASGLKALVTMGVCFDACVEHQFDRAISHATGEAGKNGGDNPNCHALIMANRKMVSKILTSTQLQEGLRRHQIQAGIRPNECLVVIKYGATRWASGHLLISRSCILYHVLSRLAQDDLPADADMAAALRDADARDVSANLDEGRAHVGDHTHVPSSDDDDDDDDQDRAADDEEEEDLRKLTMNDCILDITQWSHSEFYEGLFNPAREAMTKLQASKYNTTAIVIPIMVALRAYFEGDAFPVACRQLGDVSHKNVRMYQYPTKVFTRNVLPRGPSSAAKSGWSS